MENAVAIAQVAAPMYLVIGLSILLYAKTWQKIMKRWSKDHLELFPVMMLYPALGVICLRMYNVWEWNVWVLVTILGWALLIKGSLYFLLPGDLMKSMMKYYSKNSGWMYFAAVFALAYGGVLGYFSYFA